MKKCEGFDHFIKEYSFKESDKKTPSSKTYLAENIKKYRDSIEPEVDVSRLVD